jgi:hypothetical protein
LNYTNSFDDASMWISRPDGKDLTKPLSLVTDPKLAKKLARRETHGRMAHSPVLNMVQSVIRQQRWCGPAAKRTRISSSAIVSPAQVMPAANWSTVNKHWEKWSVSGLHNKSGGLDPLGAITAAQKSTPSWQNMSLTRDALYVNSCIIDSVEHRLAAERARLALVPMGLDKVPTMFSSSCAAHSTVLACKPSLEHTPGLSTCVVRLGHLHQSSRFAQKWTNELKELFDTHFKYRKVYVPPPGFDSWQDTNRDILRLTRVARDLSLEQEVEVARYHNGPWNGTDIVHYCLPRCPCGGTKSLARKKTLAAVSLTCGPVCQLALEYRWKKMLETCAVLLRPKLQCDLCTRVSSRIVNKKKRCWQRSRR